MSGASHLKNMDKDSAPIIIDDTLIKNLLSIPTNEGFIKECYRKILNREPDLVGLQDNLTAIIEGFSRAIIIRSFALSSEALLKEVVYEVSMKPSFIEKLNTALYDIPIIGKLLRLIYRRLNYRKTFHELLWGIRGELNSLKKEVELVEKSCCEIILEQKELSYFMYHYAEGMKKNDLSTQKKIKERGSLKKEKDIISIIIPVYNNLQYTIMCLNAVEAHTSDNIDFQVVIVDDFSTDAIEQILLTIAPDGLKKRLFMLRNKENLGYAKSVTEGIKKAAGNIILLLNNDIIVTKGWIEALLSSLDKQDGDIIGSKLLYPNGAIQHAGGVFCYDKMQSAANPYHIYRGFHSNFIGVNKQRHFKWVTFACVMLTRRLFEDIGGFDNKFRNGCEDVDFCIRAVEKGYSVLYEPGSVSYHLECGTRGYNNPEEVVNRQLLSERHKVIAEDDFHYYLEDGIPVEYGREYERLFCERVRNFPFTLEILKDSLK